jgi:hypothetical protein
MTYIDYAKAFDSVPHDWLLKVMEIYKVCPKIRETLKSMMSSWKTRLYANNENVGEIDIKRGIFQGDSLSPLWFCLALGPLSTMLNLSTIGYKITKNGKKINHMLFMDDLKLYSDSPEKLKSLINTVKIFSKDINMTFGLDKCAYISVKNGKIDKQDEPFEEIAELEEGAVYKYLGIQQNSKIDHTQIKKEFTQKYKKRLTKICNTKLTGGRMVEALNCWAIPVLTYSFGVVKWSDTDLEALDRLTRVTMTKFRSLHPNSSATRLYLPRKEGGRGLLNLEKMCKAQVQNMRIALKSSNDELMKAVVEADERYTPLDLAHTSMDNQIRSTRDNVEEWKSKELHGRFPKMLEEAYVDKKGTLQFLLKGQLYPETEGFVCAIQDRVIRTRNYEKHIMKMNVDDRCRKCGRVGETIEHIVSGCTVLANTAYLGRHNQLAKLIHQQLAMKYGILGRDTPPYYKYDPAPVLETPSTVVYWDRPLNTDRTVDHNRPDIVVINKHEKTAFIIDIAVPLTNNIRSTEVEKIRKYEDLAIQIKDIWKLQSVKTYPFVISAEGVLSKNFIKNLEKLELPVWIHKTAQKLILLQTCHIARKFLNDI